MAYALQGSAPTMTGSRHTLIYVAASSNCLRKSAIRDQQMALVIPLATFRLWRGFWHKAAIL